MNIEKVSEAYMQVAGLAQHFVNDLGSTVPMGVIVFDDQARLVSTLKEGEAADLLSSGQGRAKLSYATQLIIEHNEEVGVAGDLVMHVYESFVTHFDVGVSSDEIHRIAKGSPGGIPPNAFDALTINMYTKEKHWIATLPIVTTDGKRNLDLVPFDDAAVAIMRPAHLQAASAIAALQQAEREWDAQQLEYITIAIPGSLGQEDIGKFIMLKGRGRAKIIAVDGVKVQVQAPKMLIEQIKNIVHAPRNPNESRQARRARERAEVKAAYRQSHGRRP